MGCHSGEMVSVFVRSLALSAGADARCVTSASRTTTDGTFAVASGRDGVIRVYAASCAALLHEFATIHTRVHALHYTSFSDSLVTLESNGARRSIDLDDNDSDEETFLCVYHDWRERKMVRGYTLPLGVLDAPSFTSKANCVAVCSFTGRVAVVMGSVLNIWQCSQGFFEHVMELKVDMTQRGAFHELEFVAIHGVYVALGSSTEVRVMEIHVQHEAAGDSTAPATPSTSSRAMTQRTLTSPPESNQSPEDDMNCIHFRPHEDMDMFESIPIPLASYGEGPDDRDHLQVHERSMVSEYEGAPLILDRNEALQEECLLAGLVRGQDMRVNRALHYSVDEGDVKVLLRRFLPPNQRIKKLSFLPETIDNLMSLDSRRYTRLLIGTHNQAFLYYFLSDQTDVTRKKMAKKVFGGAASRGPHGNTASYRAPRFDSGTTSAGNDAEPNDADSRRVVMHYSFNGPISAITANSSFLFVATCSTIQVWSIWSPCHQMAATRALTSDSLPEPARPQLISVQPLRWPVRSLAALDSYLVVLPHNQLFHGESDSREFVGMSSFAASHVLPTAEIELRGINAPLRDSSENVGTLILQQSPASSILASVRAATHLSVEDRVELLLTLFAVYRYRADVGWSLLHLPDQVGGTNDGDRREEIALKLETDLYDALARECAVDLANEFLTTTSRDLTRAALFFAASRVSPSDVIQSFHDILDEEGRAQILDAIQKYLDASLFTTTTSSPHRTINRVRNQAGFTRMALQHFLEHVPEQFTRLLIDSSLPWTLDDLQFGLQALSVSAASDQLLLKIAHIVLILRAVSLPNDHWEHFQQTASNEHASLQDECSYAAVERLVDQVMTTEDGPKELTRLCVEHPDLLGFSDASGASISHTLLAQALFYRAPMTFTHILTSLFKRGIANRASVVSTSIFCISLIGNIGREASERLASLCTSGQLQDPSGWFVEEMFDADHCILTRFLSFLLDETPRLYQLAEKDEIYEDDIALETFHGGIAAEFVRECVILVTSAEKGVQLDSLASLLTNAQGERDIGDKLASWETDFVDQKILPLFADEERRALCRWLLCRGVHLVHRDGSKLPNWVVSRFENRTSKLRGQTRWQACNHYANLLILLSLAKLDRTVEGLQVISDTPDFVDLFLPYGKAFCVKLEEWRFLIETLSAKSDSIEENSGRPTDEIGVLESVLQYICATLGPEELLQVLPDDGDLALFMSTIESSVRMEDARLSAVAGAAAVASPSRVDREMQWRTNPPSVCHLWRDGCASPPKLMSQAVSHTWTEMSPCVRHPHSTES